MNESRKMNFRIEDGINEAYEQMNEAQYYRKDEVKSFCTMLSMIRRQKKFMRPAQNHLISLN